MNSAPATDRREQAITEALANSTSLHEWLAKPKATPLTLMRSKPPTPLASGLIKSLSLSSFKSLGLGR